ncbi:MULTISPECIES: orotidine-5'-phosphate decarboxylase [Bacillaceae]|uniref:orotidine-5'-phosphate decarboxylase n=1 Tax=Bacillaceae TaxID=186817 RepID=UPI0006F4ACFC|nr:MULTISPECIES: orotidine-5'-phosphate decarboxylase [Bacillaceae]KQL36525.1 orotidine 5'-phosphate decarboxylase [Psychrobacillus sp. FJAT-21963]MDF2068587.1 orotidine-5'-phosphate decarboxylase [Bacillus sp. Cr_A10]
MKNSPIIALDFATAEDVYQFLSPFEQTLFVKVGMELYLQEGPSIVYKLKEMGHDVFLDLKLHDIPNTVGQAMKGLARLGADLVNIHAAGGEAMMSAAREGLEAGTAAGNRRPSIIAVTQLTSTSEKQMQEEQLIQATIDESVVHYAKLAKQANLDGVVCSVLEAKKIAEACGNDFLRVTPGIRLAEGDTHDQVRVATPSNARVLGSSHIVVGRAITKAENPVFAYEKVLNMWEENA